MYNFTVHLCSCAVINIQEQGGAGSIAVTVHRKSIMSSRMEKERIHKVQLAKILIFNVFKRKDKNKDNDRTPKLFFEKVL